MTRSEHVPPPVHIGYTHRPFPVIACHRNQRPGERELDLTVALKREQTRFDGTPEAGAQVRILPWALCETAGQRRFSALLTSLKRCVV